MRIAGVICEYNPFHAGHAYHLRRLRETTRADALICLMSGEFTQRGEAAICDKWTRAEMALRSGADAVLELPFIHSISSAQQYAQAGVRILDALGCRYLGFGAEEGNLEALAAAAHILLTEPDAFGETLRKGLTDGDSYSRAVREALAAACPGGRELAAGPNNMLAVQYLRALEAIGSDMQPVVTVRRGQKHQEFGLQRDARFASSGAIRGALRRSQAQVSRILTENGVPLRFEPLQADHMLFVLLTSQLRGMPPERLSHVTGMEPGLPWRLVRAAETSHNFEEMLQRTASRRHTASRIRRILLNAYFGITDEVHLEAANENAGVQLLGVRKNGLELLSWLADYAETPVAPTPLRLPDTLTTKLSVQACDLYGLLMKPVRAARQDYRRKLLVV